MCLRSDGRAELRTRNGSRAFITTRREVERSNSDSERNGGRATKIVTEDVEAISPLRVSELEHVLGDRCRHIVGIGLVAVRIAAQVGRYEADGADPSRCKSGSG